MYAHSQRDRGAALVWIAAAFLAGSFLAIFPARGADTPDNPTRALVQEALQRETYGLPAEREALLRSAIKQDAEAPQPHWYLGEVRSADGEWEQAGKVQDPRAGQLIREYRLVRDSKADDAQGQKSLGEWCASKDLRQQARAHWLRSLAHNPQQAELRQRLGLVRVGQQWYEPAAFERARDRARDFQQAHDHWLPVFNRLGPQLSSPIAEKRSAAIAEVMSVKSPLALPVLQAVIGTRGEEQQEVVLRTCEQIDDPLSSELVAFQACESPFPRLRKLAAEILKARETADYVPLMISEMYTPVVSKVELVDSIHGGLLRRTFWREGADQHEVFVSDAWYHSTLNPAVSNRLGRSVDATTALMLRYDSMMLAINRSLASSESIVAARNEATQQRNERIAEALTISTGTKLSADPAACWKWWMDLNEWTQPYGKSVATKYQRNTVTVIGLEGYMSVSCLTAGTPITTDQGLVAVERVRAGDLVLARDIESGELGYKPVLHTTLRPKKQLFRITAGKDTFEATGGHLFWVSGQGWTRARELKPGQILHGAGAPVSVLNVEDGIVAETYNLVVADYGTYFVGTEQILSHDNTPRRPTRVTVPGLEPE